MSAAPYRRTFVRLLGFLGPYRWSLVVSTVLAVLSQAAAIAMVVLVSITIDGIDDQRGTGFLAWTTEPESHGSASAHSCEPTASTIEKASEIRYGHRNRSSLTKVAR